MALSKLKKFAVAYKEEIICNPTFATEVECGLKCISYLISGELNGLEKDFEFWSSSAAIDLAPKVTLLPT